MLRRRRVRRAVKWAAVAACVLLGSSWALTTRWSLYRDTARGGEPQCRIGLMRGSLYYSVGPPPFAADPRGATWHFRERREVGWIPRVGREPGIAGSWLTIDLPLWIPLVLLSVPTALLWRADRRSHPGQCPCGYDLTGNTTGVCPECGKTIGRHS